MRRSDGRSSPSTNQVVPTLATRPKLLCASFLPSGTRSPLPGAKPTSSGPTPSGPGPPPAWLLPGLPSSRLELHADPAVSSEQTSPFSGSQLLPPRPTTCLPGSPPPPLLPLPPWDESEVSGYGTLKSFFFFLVPPWISVKRGAEPYSCRLLSTPQFLATQLPDPERIQTSPEKRREPANKAAVGPWAVWQPGPPLPRLSSRPSIERNPGPASRLQTWPLGPHCSPPHPAPAKPTPRATRVHAPSQLLLRAPTLLSTPAPGPTSTAGKNQAGGRGRARAAGEIAAALATSAAPGRGFREGYEGQPRLGDSPRRR